MPRSGGNYTLPNPPIQNGATLDATPVQGNFSDIATALSASVAKDGQTVPTANLPMGGFKHTGVANATARTEYASAAQVQDSGLQWLASVSGTDTITATATPAITAYAAGQAFRFVAAGANTGAVTLNVNGVGAANVTKNGTTALVAGDIPSGAVLTVVYDGTRFQLINLGQVVASQIAAGAVDTASIADAAVTLAKIAASTVTPFPIVGAGVGQFVVFTTLFGGGYTLPSGGTWLRLLFGYNSSGQIAASFSFVIVAGGSVLAGSAGVAFTGFAWRIA